MAYDEQAARASLTYDPRKEEEAAQIRESLGVEAEKKDISQYEVKTPRHEDPLVTIERGIDLRLMRMRTEAEVYLIEAARLKAAGKPLAAGAQVSAYAATRAGVGAIEGLTLPFRPIAIAETAGTLAGLATSAEKRTQFVGAVAADPVGIAAEMAGGYLGAAVSPLNLRIRRQKIGKPPEPKSPATVYRGAWPVSGSKGFGKSRGSVVILQKPQLKQLPRVPKYLDPYALTVASTVGLRHKVIPTDTIPRTVSGLRGSQAWADPITRMTPLTRVEPKIRDPVKEEEKRISRPKVAPLVTPKPIVIPRQVTSPTITFPQWTPRPLQDITTIPKTIPKTIDLTEIVQVQNQRTAAVPIPLMRRAKLEAPATPRMRRRKKKKGYDPLKLDIWGEVRVYPVKTPREVLKRLGL